MEENKNQEIKELVERMERLEKEASLYEGEEKEPIENNIEKLRAELEEGLNSYKEQIEKLEKEYRERIERLEKEASLYEGEEKEPIENNIEKLKIELEEKKEKMLNEIESLGVDLEKFGFKEHEEEKEEVVIEQETTDKEVVEDPIEYATRLQEKLIKLNRERQMAYATRLQEQLIQLNKERFGEQKEEQAKSVEEKPAEVKPTQEKTEQTKPTEVKSAQQKQQEYDKLVNKEYMQSLDEKIDEALREKDSKEREATVNEQIAQKPEQAKPAQAKPAQAKPAQAKPAEAKPAEAKPAQARPIQAKPAEAKLAEAKPAQARPIQAKPTQEKPVEVKNNDAVKVLYYAKGDNYLVKDVKNGKFIIFKRANLDKRDRAIITEKYGKDVDDLDGVDMNIVQCLYQYDKKFNATALSRYMEAATKADISKKQRRDIMQENGIDVEYSLKGLYSKASDVPKEEKGEILQVAKDAKRAGIATVERGIVDVLNRPLNRAKEVGATIIQKLSDGIRRINPKRMLAGAKKATLLLPPVRNIQKRQEYKKRVNGKYWQSVEKDFDKALEEEKALKEEKTKFIKELKSVVNEQIAQNLAKQKQQEENQPKKEEQQIENE